MAIDRQAVRDVERTVARRKTLTETYHLEHEALEPRTASAWDHTESNCSYCRPFGGNHPNHPSILPG